MAYVKIFLCDKIFLATYQHKKADAAQIFHDTAGWKHLETSMRFVLNTLHKIDNKRNCIRARIFWFFQMHSIARFEDL